MTLLDVSGVIDIHTLFMFWPPYFDLAYSVCYTSIKMK